MDIFKNKKIIASALTFVMFMALMQPPLLRAKDRRGSTVVVTMNDGRMVRGELLAVKADALLVYNYKGERLDLQQVAKVKVLKKLKFLQGLGIGFLVGLALSEYSYKIAGNDEELSGLIYFFLPPQTGLLGGIFGALSGLSQTFHLENASSQNAQQILEQLKRHAREQAGTQQPKSIWHRFHLLWLPSRQNISTDSDSYEGTGSFRFVNNAPSKDTGVYPCNPFSYVHEHVRTDQFRLEYELTPHFSSSLEFIASGKLNGYVDLDTKYFSTDYGKQYETNIFISNEYSYTALLLGVNWKPVLPSNANKHMIELGIAAGPAQVNLNSKDYMNANPPQKFKDLTWSCKIHAAYDYSLFGNVLLGVFIGYQNLRASFPGLIFINEKQEFWPEGQNNDFVIRFTRPTEFSIPRHRVQLDGKIFGFRVGVRF